MGNSLAIISMVGYGVWQPARLVIQAVVLRNQPHGNRAPNPTIDNRYLEGKEQLVGVGNRGKLLGRR